MRTTLPPALLSAAVLAALTVLSTVPVARAATGFSQTACIRVERTLELAASVGDVWVAVTSSDGFCALTGFSPKDGAKQFQRVGDVMTAHIGEDDGRLVCTEFDAGKDLRVSWEPQNGSYLCHKWVRLRPTPTGTKLIYVDRYTDDQLATAEKTAQGVAADTDKALAAFKAKIEAR